MKGLFGRRTDVPDALLNAMPQMQSEVTYTPQAQAVMQGQAEMPKPRGYWQGGDRFTGRDAIAGALAAIGDGLQNWAGGQGGAIQNLMAPRVMQREMAAKQQLMAAQRAAEMQDFAAQQQIKAQYREPTEFEQALRLANIDPASEQGVQLARERATRLAQGPDPLLQSAPIPGGGSYTGPYSGYAQVVQPQRPVGGLQPIEPTMANTPAPQVGPNGMPATVTRAQFQAIVAEMGEASARAWAQRNNVRIGN